MIKLYLEKRLDKKSSVCTIIHYKKEIHHSLIPQLYAEGFGDKPWGSDWNKWDFFDPEGVFLALVSGRYAGFVISYERDGNGHISVLTVLPEFRGRGIAEDLIVCASDYLFDRKFKKISINVEEDNEAALELYRKLGFAECVDE